MINFNYFFTSIFNSFAELTLKNCHLGFIRPCLLFPMAACSCRTCVAPDRPLAIMQIFTPFLTMQMEPGTFTQLLKASNPFHQHHYLSPTWREKIKHLPSLSYSNCSVPCLSLLGIPFLPSCLRQ